jgi:hypothetical protein
MVIYVFAGFSLKRREEREFRPFALFKLRLVTHATLNE